MNRQWGLVIAGLFVAAAVALAAVVGTRESVGVRTLTIPDMAAIAAADSSYERGVIICSTPLRLPERVAERFADDPQGFLRGLVRSQIDPGDDFEEAVEGCASTEWGASAGLARSG